MCDLKPHIEALKKAFDEYAGLHGEPDYLCMKEMKKMMQDKMSEGSTSPKHPKKVEEMFKRWDESGDEKVDFPEFVKGLATMACYANGWKCSSCNNC